MFYERLLVACSLRGERVTNVLSTLEMGSGNLSSWKSGNIPKGDTLVKLARHLCVSSDYLLGLTDDPKPHGDIPSHEDSFLAELQDIYFSLNVEGRELLLKSARSLAETDSLLISPNTGEKQAV